jgi:HlyD family secretion protein
VAVAEANLRVARNQLYAASLGTTAEAVEIARLNLVLSQNLLDQTHARMDHLEAQGRWAEKNALTGQEKRQVEEARIADLRYHAAQEPPPNGPIAAAQTAVKQAEAALDRLIRGPIAEDVQIAELRVRQAEAALEIAQLNLDDARIIAPFDGAVAAVNVRAGEPAPAVLPAIVLVDSGQHMLDVSVDEVDVARVAAGQAVSVTLDALPDQVFGGIVEKIAPAATVNAGVVTYDVRVLLAPEGVAGGQSRLRSGMTATAAIVVDEVHDVVLVPNWAIRRDRETGQAFVGLLRASDIQDVPVELGLRDEEFSEIRHGVEVGEVVAVSTARTDFSLFGGE